MANLDNIQNTFVTFDSDCIRKKSNWSKTNSVFKIDSKDFQPELFLKSIPSHSPKVDDLLKNIEKLDKEDMKKDGHLYKHFIFCDIKSSGQGAKMVASALIAKGFHLGYFALKKGEKKQDSPKTPKEAIEKVRPDTPRPSFALTPERKERDFKSMSKIEEGSEESSQKGGAKNEKKYQKIELFSHSKLNKTKNENFYLLSSVNVFDQPINVGTKKQILANFNARPSNIHGKEVRFIVMDSGFKEGIDLFDIKYVHIFEPPVNFADMKQVIGRGTRTCGQKGLKFHPTMGWPLHVYVYDLKIPESIQENFLNSKTAFDMYLTSLNMDMKLVNFLHHMEDTSIFGAVDYELNKAVHEFSVMKGGGPKKKQTKLIIQGTPIIVNEESNTFVQLPSGQTVKGLKLDELDFVKMRNYIKDNFSNTKWEDVKMENMCDDSVMARKKGGSNVIQYTPTQRFIKQYFTPQCPVKGMLLWHSTGTGKTCSAIAAATSSFAVQKYTILWVTRTTLKNDIWKNMFDQICNEQIRTMVSDGVSIPKDHNKRMKLLSDAWRIRPISYKQFSNLVSKENSYYDKLVNINGSLDPLRKTLLIIDEAHKLYGGGDLIGIERPDMNALHKSLMTSYATSGRDSVRVLLMTATPITEDPMELVKLINLTKLPEKQMHNDFATFSSVYLNEDGSFHNEGKKKYLDEIAGHISYLNREKDARQFAQPQIHPIYSNIIDDVKNIHSFDKKYVRSINKKEIDELKMEIERENEKIDKEYQDIDASLFSEVKEFCNQYEGKLEKGCLKIANENIRELVKEVKSEGKVIKDKIKKIRNEIKSKNLFQKTALKKMQEISEKNPEKYKQFQNSVYFAIKYECGKTKKKPLNHLIDETPEIVVLKQKLREFDQSLTNMENEVKQMAQVHKNKLIYLRGLLKISELNQLETFVVKDAIKQTSEKHKEHVKNRKKEMVLEKKEIVREKKSTEKEITNLRKTLKKRFEKNKKEELQENKENKKAERKLNKTLRKQGIIINELKNEKLRGLMDKYIVKAKYEFQDKRKEIEEKIKETNEKKKQREEEKTRRKKEKESQNKTKKKH